MGTPGEVDPMRAPITFFVNSPEEDADLVQIIH
jgi:hypothetical protein